MSLDVLQQASSRKIVGSLAYFDLDQEGMKVRVTCQVTDLEMRNTYHEQSHIKNAIKTRASIQGISGLLDIMTASVAPGAVFSRGDDRELWGFDVVSTVPPSGTPVYRMTQDVIDELVEAEKDDIFQMGRAYGDDSVSLPMLVKHFGSPTRAGLGEAVHSLAVGKTGAGKSTLAKMILMGYARHEDMAILIIDPKGEFADEIEGYEVGSSGLPMRGILKGMNRATRRFGITQIKLETWELFEEVMNALGLDRDLNIRGVDNKEELAKAIVEILKKGGIALEALRGRDTLVHVLESVRGPEEEDEDDDGYLSQIYKGKESRDSLRKQINRILENPDHRIFGTWDFLGYLFEKGDGSRPTISQLVRQVMASKAGDRPLAVIDLSIPGNRRDFNDLPKEFEALKDANEERELFTDAIQKKILYRIASDLRRTCESIVAERMREGNRDNVNTVVVFEEAHRFAPRHVPSDESDDARKLKAKLIEAVRETRKFGLGWFFIDQTVGGLDKEIIQQVRCAYIGFGLSMGEELAAVKDMIGGDQRDLSLYRSFRDPASFGKGGKKKFPWMCVGPVSPMAANRPLFFNAFGGEEFVERNGLNVDRTDRPMRLVQLTTKAARAKATNARPVTLDDLDEDFLR
jgi:energy-coupling factor transporter ATP-binding protein EcfA2